jgi:hypothetical protein
VKIENVCYVDGELRLKTADPSARKFAYQFKAGDYDIVKAKRRRSLDANALAWKLIHDIAGEIGISPDEVYRDAVRNIGGVRDVICIREKAKDTFIRAFTSGHLGRQVEEMPSKLKNCVTLVCIYGSSDYSVQQMSHLIDNLLQDCAALGIETPEEARINSLLEEWGKR